MPITLNAKKKLRQDKKRRIKNIKIKDALKTAVKEYKRNPTEKLLSKVYSLLDNAVKKNIFHKNKSSRLKARLSKLIKTGKQVKKDNAGTKIAKPVKRTKKTSKKS